MAGHKQRTTFDLDHEDREAIKAVSDLLEPLHGELPKVKVVSFCLRFTKQYYSSQQSA